MFLFLDHIALYFAQSFSYIHRNKKHRLGVIYAVTIKHRLGLKLHKYITE